MAQSGGVKCWSAIITMPVWAAYPTADARVWLTTTERASIRTYTQTRTHTLCFSIKHFSDSSEWPWRPPSFDWDYDPAGASEKLIIGALNYFWVFFCWRVKSQHIIPVAEKTAPAKKLMFRGDIGSRKWANFISVFYFVMLFSVVSSCLVCFVLGFPGCMCH